MKRERNQKNANTAKSQLKVVRYYGQWVHYCTRHALHRDGMLTAPQNQAAMDIQCQICKSTFLKTTKAPEYVLLFSFPVQSKEALLTYIPGSLCTPKTSTARHSATAFPTLLLPPKSPHRRKGRHIRYESCLKRRDRKSVV